MIFLLVPLIFASSAFAVTPTPKRSMCSLFLSSAMVQPEASNSNFPFADGSLPKDFDERILLSPGDVRHYLAVNPKTPFRNELTSLTDETFDGNKLIYVAEFGPTLWKSEEFGQWTKTVGKGYFTNPKKARSAILTMARGGDVEGFSTASHERVRNSLSAKVRGMEEKANIDRQLDVYLKQGSLSDDDIVKLNRLASGIAPKDPHDEGKAEFFDKMMGHNKRAELPDIFDGQNIDFSKIPPEQHMIIIFTSFEVWGAREGLRVEREWLLESPSINLPWSISTDPSLDPESLEELFTLRDNGIALRTTRMLMREALVRRRMVGGQTLADLISEDEIFYYSLYPEFLPYWRSGLRGKNPIPVDEVGEDFYSFPLKIAKQNGRVELLTLEVSRPFFRSREFKFSERIQANLIWLGFDADNSLKTRMTQSDIAHVKAWLRENWAKFQKISGFSENVSFDVGIDINWDDNVHISPRGEKADAAVIAFFMYLQEGHDFVGER